MLLIKIRLYKKNSELIELIEKLQSLEIMYENLVNLVIKIIIDYRENASILVY